MFDLMGSLPSLLFVNVQPRRRAGEVTNLPRPSAAEDRPSGSLHPGRRDCVQWTTSECSPGARPPLLLSGCRTQGPWFTLFTPPECQGGSEQEGVRGQVLATSTWASRARRTQTDGGGPGNWQLLLWTNPVCLRVTWGIWRNAESRACPQAPWTVFPQGVDP